MVLLFDGNSEIGAHRVDNKIRPFKSKNFGKGKGGQNPFSAILRFKKNKKSSDGH